MNSGVQALFSKSILAKDGVPPIILLSYCCCDVKDGVDFRSFHFLTLKTKGKLAPKLTREAVKFAAFPMCSHPGFVKVFPWIQALEPTDFVGPSCGSYNPHGALCLGG